MLLRLFADCFVVYWLLIMFWKVVYCRVGLSVTFSLSVILLLLLFDRVSKRVYSVLWCSHRSIS